MNYTWVSNHIWDISISIYFSSSGSCLCGVTNEREGKLYHIGAYQLEICLCWLWVSLVPRPHLYERGSSDIRLIPQASLTLIIEVWTCTAYYVTSWSFEADLASHYIVRIWPVFHDIWSLTASKEILYPFSWIPSKFHWSCMLKIWTLIHSKDDTRHEYNQQNMLGHLVHYSQS